MKGMVLVAGEGKRARPLTEYFAKPALPLPGGTILTYIIGNLAGCGINEIAINLHHLSRTIYDAIEKYPLWNVRINPFDEPFLAGSGGGFYRIRDFFGNEPFLIVNGDILIDSDYSQMFEFYQKQGGLVAFLGRPDYSGDVRVLDADEDGNVIAIRKQPAIKGKATSYKFCGAMVVNPEIFKYFPDAAIIDFFDDVLIPMLRRGMKIGKVFTCKFELLEFGTPYDYYRNSFIFLKRIFQEQESSKSFIKTGDYYIHRDAAVSADAVLNGTCSIGPNAVLEGDCRLKNVIVHKDASLDNCALENAIVMPYFKGQKKTGSRMIYLPDGKEMAV